MATKKKLGWYGVRTLVRVVASGKPKMVDKNFDPNATLLEDRVVLFQADSFESAIKQAKDEAQRYCKSIEFVNIYGQKVRLKFLKTADAFSLMDQEPSAGCEVYSSTVLVPESVSNADLLVGRLGKAEKGGSAARLKFIPGELLKK